MQTMTDNECYGEELLQADLLLLRNQLLEMGTASEELVRDAVRALTAQDSLLAVAVVSHNSAVRRMEGEIEAHCLRLMARRLSATRIRQVGAILKVITEIQRISDHAVDIARVAQRMQREMLYKPLVDIPQMGELVCRMLRVALQSFLAEDSSLADTVIRSDTLVDDLYRRSQQELRSSMNRDAASVSQASHLLFVVHYLERIGDHCANIAERIAFIETGKRLPIPRETPGAKRLGAVPA